MASPPPPPDRPPPTSTALTPPTKRAKTTNPDTTEPFPDFTDAGIQGSMSSYRTPGNPAPTTEGQPSILPTKMQQLESRVHILESTLATNTAELRDLRNRIEVLESARSNLTNSNTNGVGNTNNQALNNATNSTSMEITRSRSRSANLINITFRLASPSVLGSTLPTTPGTPDLSRETRYEFTIRRDDTLAGMKEVVAGRVGRRVEELVLLFDKGGGPDMGVVDEMLTAAELGVGEGGVVVVDLVRRD